MKCPACGSEDFYADTQVLVWQRCHGEYDSKTKTFYAVDTETLYDTEETVKTPVLVCTSCYRECGDAILEWM